VGRVCGNFINVWCRGPSEKAENRRESAVQDHLGLPRPQVQGRHLHALQLQGGVYSGGDQACESSRVLCLCPRPLKWLQQVSVSCIYILHSTRICEVHTSCMHAYILHISYLIRCLECGHRFQGTPQRIIAHKLRMQVSKLSEFHILLCYVYKNAYHPHTCRAVALLPVNFLLVKLVCVHI
jgi:hypothetical protein